METLKYSIIVHEHSDLSELTKTETSLVDKAKEAAEKSYSPYSNFKVGASVLLDNDEIICGNNQENSAYPSGLCAERVVIFYANAHFPDSHIVAMAVVAKSNNKFTSEPVYPCGSCRQVMNETEVRFKAPIKLILAGDSKIHILDNVSQLLPHGFDKRLLDKK